MDNVLGHLSARRSEITKEIEALDVEAKGLVAQMQACDKRLKEIGAKGIDLEARVSEISIMVQSYTKTPEPTEPTKS